MQNTYFQPWMVAQLVAFCLERLLHLNDLMEVDRDNLDVKKLIITNMGDADRVFGVEMGRFNSVDFLTFHSVN